MPDFDPSTAVEVDDFDPSTAVEVDDFDPSTAVEVVEELPEVWQGVGQRASEELSIPSSSLLGSYLGRVSSGAMNALSGIPDFVETAQNQFRGTAMRPKEQPELDRINSELASLSSQYSGDVQKNLQLQKQAEGLIRQRNSLLSAPSEKTVAGEMRQIADESFAAYGADPRSTNFSAQFGRGMGTGTLMLPTMGAGSAAMPLAGLQFGSEAYADTFSAVKRDAEAKGATPREADQIASDAATGAAIETGPALGVFMGIGKLGALAGTRLAGAGASPARQLAFGTGTAIGANVAGSSLVRGAMGGDFAPNVETLTTDVLLGLTQGGAAVRQNPLTDTVRTPIGTVDAQGKIIHPDAPEGVALRSLEGLKATEPTEIPPPSQDAQNMLDAIASRHSTETGTDWVAVRDTLKALQPKEATNPELLSVMDEALQLAEQRAPSPIEQQTASDMAPDVVESPRTRGLQLSEGQEGNVGITDVLQSYEGVMRSLGSNTPLRSGRIAQSGAEGIYKIDPEVARTRRFGQIDVASHEVAHDLQNQLFGQVDSSSLKASLPPAVVRELDAMGSALYGPKVPKNGYTSEGWAEFFRHYLTRDDAAMVAPKTVEYMERTVFPANQKFAESIRQAKSTTDTYRNEGPLNRANAMQVETPGEIRRIVNEVSEPGVFKEQLVDRFEPLQRLSRDYQKATGKALSPASDPYETAKFFNMGAAPRTVHQVTEGVVDPWGNRVLDASGAPMAPLKDILMPVRKNKAMAKEFDAYMLARRTQELAVPNTDFPEGRQSGMPLEDANKLVTSMEAKYPQFATQAEKFYEWNRAAGLDYAAKLNPEWAPMIEKIKANNQNYIPLSRDFSRADTKKGAKTGAGSPFKRLTGSMRPIKNIWDQTITNTQKIIAASHRQKILRNVAELADTEGAGHLVEEVPRSKVMETVNIGKVRSALDDLGVDTSHLPDDQVVKFYSLAQKPGGVDPIVAVERDGGTKWYQVTPKAYEVLAGIENHGFQNKFAQGLWNTFLRFPTKLFRLGTTAYRGSFGLITNPQRDLATFMFNTQSTDNPAKAMQFYSRAIKEKAAQLAGADSTPYSDAFDRLGLDAAQPLGPDVYSAKKLNSRLFDGRIATVVKHPLEAMAKVFSITEKVPRIAELMGVAKKVGWEPGTEMTPDQAVQMANAASKVTVDFRQAGKLGRWLNDAMPFFNAAVQGGRTFYRNYRDRPAAAALKTVSYLMGPSLALWYANKDKEWYREMPFRERYTYHNIEAPNGNVIRIAKPQEFSAWGAIMEGALDSMYRRNPEAFEASFGQFFKMHNPVNAPVLLNAAIEQAANKNFFWDRPIVPRNQTDLPPGEQVSEFTSATARKLGELFPDKLSPRRIDALANQLGGGFGADLLRIPDVVGGKTGSDREKEIFDFPILGKQFRAGGQFNSSTLSQNKFWEDYMELSERAKSKARPMTEGEANYWVLMEQVKPMMKILNQSASGEPNSKKRQEFYRSAAELARLTVEQKPKK